MIVRTWCLGAVLEIVIRDGWGRFRQRGWWALVAPAAVTAGLSAVFIPLGLAFGSVLAAGRAEARYEGAIQAVAAAVFYGWIATGVFLGARYTLQIDLTRLVRLPLGFFTAWAVRGVAGLWGSWLVWFAPVLLGFAWTASESWAGFAWRAVLIAEFAWLTSELTVALRWRYAWLAARRRSLVMALVLGWVVITPLMLVVVRGPSAAGRLAERLFNTVAPTSPALLWLPPGALGRALSGPGVAALGWPTALLSVWLLLALIFSYRSLRRALLVHPVAHTTAQRAAKPLLACVEWGMRRLSPARQAPVAMAAIEAISLARIWNVRMLVAMGVPYFIVFPMLLPLDEFGAVMSVIMLSTAFMFCSSLKCNVLGIDAVTVRQYFVWPVSPAAALRARLAVVNLLITVLCAESVAVIALRGTLGSTAEVIIIAGAFASLLFATDVAGGRWSLRAPVAVAWGRAFPVANNAGSLAIAGTIMAITLLYVGLVVAVTRFSLEVPAEAVAVLVPVTLALWPWSRFRLWAAPALTRERERVLAKLRA